MSEYIAELRDDVRQWKLDLAKFEAEGAFQVAAAIKNWVAEAERIIKESGPKYDA